MAQRMATCDLVAHYCSPFQEPDTLLSAVSGQIVFSSLSLKFVKNCSRTSNLISALFSKLHNEFYGLSQSFSGGFPMEAFHDFRWVSG